MNQISPFSTAPDYDAAPIFDSLVITNFISGPKTGPLHLLSDPTAPLDAATKQYVDAGALTAVPVIANTPPSNPFVGQLWFDNVSGELFIWYVDPNSSQWIVTNGGGLSSAPSGGVPTVGGVDVVPIAGAMMTGALILSQNPVAPFGAATKTYVDVATQKNLPLTGGVITGPVTVTTPPTQPNSIATKAYVDAHTAVLFISDIPPASPVSGMVWFDSVGVQTYTWYANGWVPLNSDTFTSGPGSGSSGGNLGEAPTDGRIYGRDGSHQSWTPVVPTAGGTLTGALNLYSSSPSSPLEAASKGYVDAVALSGEFWQGTYIIAFNTPALNSFTPGNGQAWTAVTQNPSVAEPLTVNLPGIASGTIIHNGDVLRATGGVYYLVGAGGLTSATADATYVRKSGDHMTGTLVLASDPAQDLEAATKRYADKYNVIVANTSPGSPYQGQLWYDTSVLALKIWVATSVGAMWEIV